MISIRQGVNKMAYYSPKEMQEVLQQYPQYRDKLYCRGFLITTSRKTIDSDYPFYSNWSEQIIVAGKSNYYL